MKDLACQFETKTKMILAMNVDISLYYFSILEFPCLCGDLAQ